MTDSSTQGIKTVLHPVTDLAAAKAVYTALLGAPPAHDAEYYVGYEVAGQHIGLVPGGGEQGMASPVAYWHVDDIEAKLTEVTAAGATVKEPAHDVGGGRLVATFADPDGNVLGVLQEPVRFDWGPAGAARLARTVDVLVVVDTMSFSTSVDIAVGRGASVRPLRWADDVRPGRAVSSERPYSLSPASLTGIAPGTQLELASPNGATICLDAADAGATVIAGCLRNAIAVGRALAAHGGAVGVVAAGERWPDGSLRPAVEDLVGAGSVLAAMGTASSPEAQAAIAAAGAVSRAALEDCASARELVEMGFAEDVGLALARDVSGVVPILVDGWFTAGRGLTPL